MSQIPETDRRLFSYKALGGKTVFAELPGFGLLHFIGDDARQFLQGQLSCDVNSLEAGQAQYGSYNTPQGRILASFLLWRDEPGYVMQLPRNLCGPLLKRLSMYIMRSNLKAEDTSDRMILIGVAGADAETAVKSVISDIPSFSLALTTTAEANLLRVDASRFQIIAPPKRAAELRVSLGKFATQVGPEVWDWLDIMAGIPWITPSSQDQYVPQMLNFDLIGGVSFTKGCYPGQEIVARMHYLGRLKQRMYLANIPSDIAPQPGDKLYSANSGDQASGMIVNAAQSPVSGYDVLASVRIERVAAGDVHWRSFDGPRLVFMPLPYYV